MPQAEGVLIKHLVAPDSGAMDKVYGIDWNNLDDLLRGALEVKIEHLGKLRITDDTVVIDENRDLVGLRYVAQDLDPDGAGTRDLGDADRYWNEGWIKLVKTRLIYFGDASLGNLDVVLYRGAVNRLDLETGDSFNIVNGNFMIGGTILLTSAKKMQNIVSIIQDLDPDAPDTYDIGDLVNYWKLIVGKTIVTSDIDERVADGGVTIDDVLIKDRTISLDTISERTVGAGVTIDNILIKDKTISVDTIDERTIGAGVEVDGVILQDYEVIADKIWLDRTNQDVNLYRGGPDLLKTDDEMDVAGLLINGCRCITSNCVASNLGFPYKEGSGFSDSDFECVKDGLLGIEGTEGAEKIWFRAHGTWHSINT